MIVKRKIDLHNHFTTMSRVLDPNRVADRVYETLGQEGICALVNYQDRRFEAFAERSESIGERLGNAVYFSDRNVMIIKGEEIRTRQGDLLVLGLEEGVHPTPRRHLDDTLEEAREYPCAICAPHPYFHSKLGLMIERFPDYASEIDFIETYNGNASRRANDKAKNLWSHNLKESGWGRVSSSDGHSFREVGSSYSFTPLIRKLKEVNSLSLIDEIKETAKKISSYKETRSYLGLVQHTAILLPHMLPIIGKRLSRGDKEALR